MAAEHMPIILEQNPPLPVEKPFIVDDNIVDDTNDGQVEMAETMPENNMAQKIAKNWVLGKGNLILFLVIVIFVAIIVGRLLSL